MQTKTKIQLIAVAVLVLCSWYFSRSYRLIVEQTTKPYAGYEPMYKLQIEEGKAQQEHQRLLESQKRSFDEHLRQIQVQGQIDNAWKAAKRKYDRILFDRKLNNIPFNVHTEPELRDLRREIEDLEKKGVSSDAQMEYLEEQVGKLKR